MTDEHVVRCRRTNRPTRALVLGTVAVTACAVLVTTPPAASAEREAGPAAAVAVSAVAVPRAATGVLSPRLTQLRTLVAEDDRVLSGRSAESPLADLSWDGSGRVLVQVRLTDVHAATVAPLRDLGEVVSVGEELGRVTVWVRPVALDALAAVPAVQYVSPVLAPVLGGERLGIDRDREPSSAAGAARAGSPAVACGSVTSEADVQLRAAAARAAASVDGTGVPIGVLSDSYDVARAVTTTAADDIASGDLPGPGNPCGRTTPVTVLQDAVHPDAVGDEGRAMLQLVHDLAPGSPLLFATGMNGPDAMADNIRRLAAAGAKVIVDDISYTQSPFFQQGVIDRAIADVTAAGVTYVTSAGNSNVILDGRDVSSWETPAVTLTSCVHTRRSCVDFDPKHRGDWNQELRIASGGSIRPLLQWAQPFGKVTTDFDLLLLDARTGELLASSRENNLAGQEPIEELGWQNLGPTARTVQLVVQHRSGRALPRLKLLFVRAYGLKRVEHDVSARGNIVGPTVFGHSGSPHALSVGAVGYDDATRAEPFSSRGPVTHYFGPVRAGGSPRLATRRVIAAPQVVATDGAATTFFSQRIGRTWRFFGTSAAAPHAAAVAALLTQYAPALSPAEIRGQLAATAARVPRSAADAVGSGLVDARAALLAPGQPRVTGTTRGRGAATVSFTAPRLTGSPALDAYTARCRSDAGVTREHRRPGTSTAPIQVSGLTAGVRYRCVVIASNGSHRTASAPGAAVVPTGKPAAPGKPRVKAGVRRVTVIGRKPANTGGVRVTAYAARCVPVAGPGRTHTATSGHRKVTVTHLRPGTTYRCTVKIRNALGASPASARSRKVVPRQ